MNALYGCHKYFKLESIELRTVVEMSEGSSPIGISKTMFVVGLIAAILASSLISTIVTTQFGLIQGPKGDTGSQGAQGEQGIQGIRGPIGPAGEVEPDVKALLTSTYTDIWLGTDYHDVEGLMINFGSDSAYNVAVTITWHTVGGGEHTEPTDLIGSFSGHQIYEYSKRYYIEGGFDYITWEITWT